MDFQVGGKYVLYMRSDDGEMWNTGVFKEIIPMKKIVRMESAADEKGNAVPPSYYGHPELAMELEMIWLFDEMSDGTTRMTLTHVGLSDSIRKECEIGWNRTFDKLAKILYGKNQQSPDNLPAGRRPVSNLSFLNNLI